MRLLCLLFLLCACAPDPGLVVGTASSLGPVVEETAAGFTAGTGVRISVSWGGSLQLRRQIDHGAPLDLFLSAHPRHVEGLDTRGKPRTLARNRICLALPTGDAAPPLPVALARAERVGLAEPGVPAGDLALQTMRELAHDPGDRLVRFPHERAVVEALRRRAIDAGWIYRSSATGLVALGDDTLPTTQVVGVVLRDAPPAAESFLEALAATDAWAAHGFLPPEAP